MYTLSLVDYDGERTNFGLETVDLTAANIDAQVSAQAAFELALDDMVRGSSARSSLGNVVDANPVVSDIWAQRELKWRVDYHDAVTGDKSHVTIGTANTVRLNPNQKKVAHIGDGAEVDAFVTAFEAFARSKAGNNVVVDQILLVGRNI